MKINKYSEIENMACKASEGTVLVAAGPDLYQSDRLKRTMVNTFIKTLDWEVMRFEAGAFSEGDLKRQLHENSLFSSGKLMIISTIHKLGKASASELYEGIDRGLSDCALFLYSSKTPRESAILRKLEKKAPFYICYEPFERDIHGWVRRLAAEENISFSRDALQLLTEYSGRNLRRLSDAVTKLALYHGSGAGVDRNGLIEVISGKGGTDVFHLGDMIFRNRRGEAVSAAWSLLNYGEEPLAMIAYLFGLWQKVIRAIEIVEGGGGKKDVSAETGARYPLLDKLLKFTKTACKVDTDITAEAFAEADIELKTGADSLVVFAKLIFTLTNDHL